MNKQLLKEILSIQSVSGDEKRMNEWVRGWAKRNRIEAKFKDGNIYLCKGRAKTYPCFVAHTDTVHDIKKNCKTLTILEHEGKLIALDGEYKQTGIGGDDKVGIYIALQMLTKLSACKVALFHSEEIGCIGSNKAAVKFFSDCGFVLQADRRGHKDFVTSISGAAISSDDFQSAIKPIAKRYGYSFTSGAMTDVQALVRKGIGISCANVSCGYHAPHTSGEYVDVSQVSNTEKFFYDVAKSFAGKRFDHEYVEKKYDWSGYASYGSYGTLFDDNYLGRSNYSNWYKKNMTNEKTPVVKRDDAFQDDLSYGVNSSLGWKYFQNNGWMQQTNDRYCTSCHANVWKRENTTYFQYVCNDCGRYHMADEPMTYEEVMNLMLDWDDKQTPSHSAS